MAKTTDEHRIEWGFLHHRVVLQDSLFLGFVMALSLVLYVRGLGFYSDDWAFLETFGFSSDQSLFGLVRAFYGPDVAMRPVQIVYLSVLYWLSGFKPIGYHLINATVLTMGIVLFYFVLRELGLNRLIILAVTAVYGLLPHYSTDRFWFAAFQAALSMTLYFVSLYGNLRMLKARSRFYWCWKFLGTAGLLGSALAYEVFLPLLCLNPFIVWHRRKQLSSSELDNRPSHRTLAVLLASDLFVLGLVVASKALVTNRLGGHLDFMNRVKYVIAGSLSVNYGCYGLDLPNVVWGVLRDHFDAASLALGAVVSLTVFWYLLRAARQPSFELPGRGSMAKLIGLGLLVFVLSYSMFIVTANVGFTPTGVNNRTAIAAAMGVAFSLVGTAGVVGLCLFPKRLRRQLFCIIISLICMAGFLINNSIARFWVAAYDRQKIILTDIRERVRLPRGSTLLLDGFCPYIGPGIVFEGYWDMQGALRLTYRDRTLHGDVVTPKVRVEEGGVFTTIYDERVHYSYGQLFLYNHARKLVFQLRDAGSARRYFAEFNPDHSNGCPEGHEGFGVPVFLKRKE